MEYTDILAAMISPLCSWYDKNKRDLPWRKTSDPYCIWVSEIMLQQTRVEAALPYYERFLLALPTVHTLAKAPEEQLLKLWEGLGYYSRVKNMQKAAKQVVEEYNGEFPKDAGLLEKLPGIGSYTAGAIASIAMGLKTPAVDGNVLRVAARLCNNDEDILLPKTKKRVENELRMVYGKASKPGDLTQAIMELGALVCTPTNPKCAVCRPSRLCEAKKNDTVSKLPVRLAKQEKKQGKRTMFLLVSGGKVALVKRSAKGPLGGMWEFPAAEKHLTQPQAQAFLQDMGIQETPCAFVKNRHVFTHLVWDMKSYLVRLNAPKDAFFWFSKKELDEEIALPSAMKPFYRALCEQRLFDE